MAVTRAIAASGEQSTNTELTVTSALAGANTLYLPVVDAGAGATVADGFGVTVYNNHASGRLQVLDADGRRVAYLRPKTAITLLAVGDATEYRWVAQPISNKLSIHTAQFGTNGAVVPTLSSTGPTGMTAASSKWLKVTAETGVVYYIPVWTA